MSVTRENEKWQQKIMDLSRFASIFVMLLHFYYFWYTAFEHWKIKSSVTDRMMKNINYTGLFHNIT